MRLPGQHLPEPLIGFFVRAEAIYSARDKGGRESRPPRLYVLDLSGNERQSILPGGSPANHLADGFLDV